MTTEISVPIPTDEQGMLGRCCPNDECGRYFKIKPGTGMDTATCHCPYCGHCDDISEFTTEEQIQYAIDQAAKQLVDPLMRKFGQSLRRLNSGQRGPLRIRFDVRYRPAPAYSYVERELETQVTCDECSLEFAVYGVFASCPDCQRLNALTTFSRSIESARKRVVLASNQELDADLRAAFPRDSLRDVVAAFDSYGKALRARYPGRIRPRAKSNLFQDLDALDAELRSTSLPVVEDLLTPQEVEDVRWFFQARHVYEHNAGVVDDRFIAKVPEAAPQRGQLLPLPEQRLVAGIAAVDKLAAAIDRVFPESP